MKINIRLILQFAILLGLLTTSECNAKINSGNTISEVITIDTTDYTLLYLNPFLDSCQTDFIATENVKEDDSIGLASLKSNILLNANFSNNDFYEVAATKTNNKRFILGNMIPVWNIPRYLLFHSLLIHF